MAQKKLDGTDISQLVLSQKLEAKVDQWADDALPADRRWNGTTGTTHRLLRYWFDRDEDAPTRFFDCQRRAMETLIYCHEVLRTPDGERVRDLGDLYAAVAPEATDELKHVRDAIGDTDYAKYCLKLATGTGKTWILQAALVWQYFNALWPEADSAEYSNHFLVVAPGLVVLERLLDAFVGKKNARGNRDPNKADLKHDIFMPPEWRRDFHLRILRPEDITQTSRPEDGAFVLLLNWHKLVPKNQRETLLDEILGKDETEDNALIYTEYLTSYPDLIVFNDEAHHVHNKAARGGPTGMDAKWLEAVKTLREEITFAHGRRNRGLFMQVDFSATPFYGAGAKKEFFPHIVYDYDLKHAMNGWSPVAKAHNTLPLVKQLFLEERQSLGGELGALDFRAERDEADGKRGHVVDLSHGQKLLLEIGLKKLDQIHDEFRNAGLEKKPVLYVVCEENEVADLVFEHLKGRMDARGRTLQHQMLVLHSDKKDSIPDKEWEDVRHQLDSIDDPEDVNPKRIVVSVLMLREGFDVRNICVAVVLRSSESDILLEQMVGRGMRLMFPEPEFQQTKLDALQEIANGKEPSSMLDFLFVVEHPRFRQFYENLRQDGYPVGFGDSSNRSTSGDLTHVHFLDERLPTHDVAWPVQFHDEGGVPDPSLIDIEALAQYPRPFNEVRDEFDSILIADVHEPTENVTSTWALQTDVFDYAFFLREVTNQAVRDRKRTLLSGRRAELMGVVDDYVSEHLFGERIDFNEPENYRVLAHVPLHDFVVTQVRKALVELLDREAYDAHPEALWRRVSDVANILVRENSAVRTTKSIYPRQAPAAKGGGFEARFMQDCLEKSASVLAYAKLEQRHGLSIPYRNEHGIGRDYFPDFIVKTADKMYLVETKADRDMASPVVARKARAAMGWCDAASKAAPPEGADQPQAWEYILLSEKTYKLHGKVGFDGLLSACRHELQQLTAFGQGKLF